MSENNVKFIRVRGRVVPIKSKTYTGSKTVERDVGDRALSGLKTGSKLGAVLGASVGAIVGISRMNRLITAKGLGHTANLAVSSGALTGLKWGAAGAALGAIFGKRKGKIKVKKKKYSSV